MALERLETALHAAIFLYRISARCAQNGAAARQDSSDAVEGQLGGLIFHNPAPAFQEPYELIFVMEDSFANHGANDGI